MLYIKRRTVYSMLIDYRSDQEQYIYSHYWAASVADSLIDEKQVSYYKLKVDELNNYFSIWWKKVLPNKDLYEELDMDHDLVFNKTVELVDERVEEINSDKSIEDINKQAYLELYKGFRSFLIAENQKIQEEKEKGE